VIVKLPEGQGGERVCCPTVTGYARLPQQDAACRNQDYPVQGSNHEAEISLRHYFVTSRYERPACTIWLEHPPPIKFSSRCPQCPKTRPPRATSRPSSVSTASCACSREAGCRRSSRGGTPSSETA